MELLALLLTYKIIKKKKDYMIKWEENAKQNKVDWYLFFPKLFPINHFMFIHILLGVSCLQQNIPYETLE